MAVEDEIALSEPQPLPEPESCMLRQGMQNSSQVEQAGVQKRRKLMLPFLMGLAAHALKLVAKSKLLAKPMKTPAELSHCSYDHIWRLGNHLRLLNRQVSANWARRR